MPLGSEQSDPRAAGGMREWTLAESAKRSRFMSVRFPRNFNPFRFCAPQRQTPQERQALIAEAAYFRAEKRGFRAGHELEDWLAAEADVDRQFAEARRHDDWPKW